MPGKTKSKRNQKSQTRRKSLPQKQKFLELKNNNNNIYDLGYRIENAKKAIGIDINGFNKIKKIIYTYLFKFNPKYKFYTNNPENPNRNVDTYKVSDKLANLYIMTNNKEEFINEIEKLPLVNKRFIYRNNYYLQHLLKYIYYSDGSKVYKNKSDSVTVNFIKNLKSKGIYLPIDAEINLAEHIKSMNKEKLRENIENDRALFQRVFQRNYPEHFLNSNSSSASASSNISPALPESMYDKYYDVNSGEEDQWSSDHWSNASIDHNYDAYDLEDMGADY